MKKRLLSVFSVIAIMITMIVIISSCSNRRTDIGQTKVTTTDTAGFAQFKAWKVQQNDVAMVATKPASTATKTVSAKRTVKTASPTQTGSMSTSNQYPAKAKPKGWSKAAKGAAIGAGSGAVIGAVVNKRNRVVGAVVGGVAGGAVGYGIGRSMDKKDGRY